jgi:hypothetical protein
VNRSEALVALRRLSKEDFDALMTQPKPKELGLAPSRKELLFKLIQCEVSVSPSCHPDIEAFALKTLMPDVVLSLPKEKHPYSSGRFYEYDPAKNGQNMLKHGLGFGEVVSYSKNFGALSVGLPGDENGELRAVFSDLQGLPDASVLELPKANAKATSIVISIVQHRDERFRFISSRILPTDQNEYRKDVARALRRVLPDPEARRPFIDRCVEILEQQLMKRVDALCRINR